MLHHARVVLVMGRWGCGLVHFSTCSLSHFCPTQQPIHLLRHQFPSLSTITVFPFSTLTFSYFQVMTLIGLCEPDSSSHPSSSKSKSSAQVFSSHSKGLFDSTMVSSFSNAFLPTVITIFRPTSSYSIYLPYSSKLIIFVAPLFFHPPFVMFMFFDVHLSSFYLSSNLFSPSQFPPPSLSPISSAAQSGSSMLIDLKPIISEKEPERLSVLSNLVSFEHILSNNPSFP